MKKAARSDGWVGRLVKYPNRAAVIARSQRVRPSAGPMINSATKQSIPRLGSLWIALRSLSSGAHSRDPLARNDAGSSTSVNAKRTGGPVRVMYAFREHRTWRREIATLPMSDLSRPVASSKEQIPPCHDESGIAPKGNAHPTTLWLGWLAATD